MRFHKGTYGKETVQANSLVANLVKYPEIASTLVRQYPQYSLAYFTDGLNRIANEETIGENQFRWSVLGRTNRPSTCTGTFNGNGANVAAFTVEVEENYLNPNDRVRLKDGTNAIVHGEPTLSAGGYTLQLKVETSDPNYPGITNPAAVFGAGETIGVMGSAFPEGSRRGYENHVYPDWYTNYLTISRKSKSITGSALTDVTWIENNGQRLWYFTDQELVYDQMMWEMELQGWYGVSTVDANGNPTQLDLDGNPIYTGDGVLRQIDSANIDTYSGALTEDRITEFLTQLALNSGVKHGHWLVYTGSAGRLAFHRAMKDLIVDTGALVYPGHGGKALNVGMHFTSYSAVGQTMTLVHAPIFDDQNLHTDIDPATGYPKESFRMVFMDYNMTSGVSNLEVKVKGAGGINRGMIVKYIPGMVNPFDQDSMMAANANDSFSCEMLCEKGYIVRNPLSCGQLLFA
ncbi:MAG: hypothetical protein ACTSPB_11240 [Candidatus Thorarchaeota archaeon]